MSTASWPWPVGIGDMPQSPRPLASAQAETPPSRKRLPVSYPGIDCASNRLQSALMRKQTDAEKAEMCTWPPTGSLVALRCILSERGRSSAAVSSNDLRSGQWRGTCSGADVSRACCLACAPSCGDASTRVQRIDISENQGKHHKVRWFRGGPR